MFQCLWKHFNKQHFMCIVSLLLTLPPPILLLQGYAFEDDDSNDSDVPDHSPLLASQHSEPSTARRHLHIITGYLSAIEVLLMVSHAPS